MKIVHAINSVGNRATPGGLSLTFLANDETSIGQYVRFKYKEKTYTFKVMVVTIEPQMDEMIAMATEEGHYGQLGRQSPLNLKDFVGEEVTLVTDEEEIKSIELSARQC